MCVCVLCVRLWCESSGASGHSNLRRVVELGLSYSGTLSGGPGWGAKRLSGKANDDVWRGRGGWDVGQKRSRVTNCSTPTAKIPRPVRKASAINL